MPNETLTVTLHSLIFWESSRPPKRVMLTDVPFPYGLHPPEKGLTCYYGMRRAQREIAEALQEIHESGHQASLVNLRIAARRPKVPVAARWEEIPRLGFLHLGRLHGGAKEKVIDAWAGIMKQAGLDPDAFTDTEWRRLLPVARHPHLVYPLWRQEPFRKLAVIAYPVEINEKELGYRATLFRTAPLLGIDVIGYPIAGVDVRVPKTHLPRPRS